MKKQFLLLFMISLLFSCTNKEKESNSTAQEIEKDKEVEYKLLGDPVTRIEVDSMATWYRDRIHNAAKTDGSINLANEALVLDVKKEDLEAFIVAANEQRKEILKYNLIFGVEDSGGVIKQTCILVAVDANGKYIEVPTGSGNVGYERWRPRKDIPMLDQLQNNSNLTNALDIILK